MNDIYIWFAESDGAERNGERFIRAWTGDASKVAGLRDAIGKEPTIYRASEAASGEPVAWMRQYTSYPDSPEDAPGFTVTDFHQNADFARKFPDENTPLYTAPPAASGQKLISREWLEKQLAKGGEEPGGLMAINPDWLRPNGASGQKPPAWEATSIANELWQIADQVGYEQFRDAVTESLKTAYQDGWSDHKNGVASVTYGEQK